MSPIDIAVVVYPWTLSARDTSSGASSTEQQPHSSMDKKRVGPRIIRRNPRRSRTRLKLTQPQVHRDSQTPTCPRSAHQLLQNNSRQCRNRTTFTQTCILPSLSAECHCHNARAQQEWLFSHFLIQAGRSGQFFLCQVDVCTTQASRQSFGREGIEQATSSSFDSSSAVIPWALLRTSRIG